MLAIFISTNKLIIKTYSTINLMFCVSYVNFVHTRSITLINEFGRDIDE